LSKSFPNGSTIVIAAFGGWNDAAQSATDALEHLIETWDAQEVLDLNSDEFYDYTFNRPEVSFTLEGQREIEWPGTTVFVAKVPALPDTAIYLVLGVEPSLRWKSFCEQILNCVPQTDDLVLVTLGSMLADVPHTRPIPVNGTTVDPRLRELTGYEPSRYEGPTGILGILQSQAEQRAARGVSLWVMVPHYVASPPCPKATLSLLRGIEDLLDTNIPVDDVVEDARAWQLGVEELASDDDEIAEYVRNLEESQDTADLPEATGEAIAREFERYLRRRES